MKYFLELLLCPFVDVCDSAFCLPPYGLRPPSARQNGDHGPNCNQYRLRSSCPQRAYKNPDQRGVRTADC